LEEGNLCAQLGDYKYKMLVAQFKSAYGDGAAWANLTGESLKVRWENWRKKYADTSERIEKLNKISGNEDVSGAIWQAKIEFGDKKTDALYIKFARIFSGDLNMSLPHQLFGGNGDSVAIVATRSAIDVSSEANNFVSENWEEGSDEDRSEIDDGGHEDDNDNSEALQGVNRSLKPNTNGAAENTAKRKRIDHASSSSSIPSSASALAASRQSAGNGSKQMPPVSVAGNKHMPTASVASTSLAEGGKG